MPQIKSEVKPYQSPHSNGKPIDTGPSSLPFEDLTKNSPIHDILIVHKPTEIRTLKPAAIYPDNKKNQDPVYDPHTDPICYTNKNASVSDHNEIFHPKDQENPIITQKDAERFPVTSTPISKKKKRIKKISTPSTQVIGDIFEAYGSAFKVKKIFKSKDENSIVRCELCERDFKKKSIRSHALSLLHKSKIS